MTEQKAMSDFPDEEITYRRREKAKAIVELVEKPEVTTMVPDGTEDVTEAVPASGEMPEPETSNENVSPVREPETAENDSEKADQKEEKDEGRGKPTAGAGKGTYRFTMSGWLFNEVVRLTRALANEAVLSFGEDGLGITVVDPDHVGMIVVQVPGTEFMEYLTVLNEYDAPLKLAVDLERLKTVKVSDRENVQISGSANGDRYRIDAGGSEREIPLVDEASVKIPRIPKIESEYFVTLNVKEFRNAVNEMKTISDAARFTIEPAGNSYSFAVSAGTDSEVFRKEWSELQYGLIRGPAGRTKSLYPVEYLMKFFKAARHEDEITLRFKEDYPLKAEASIVAPKTTTKVGEVTFLLAPRMEQ